MKSLVIVLALICSSAFAAGTKDQKDDTRKPASFREPSFSFQTKEVNGGQVICGYAQSESYIQFGAGTAVSFPPTASVSCVFVPSAK